MAGLVPATHFPESERYLRGLWKMDGRHEGGHDDLFCYVFGGVGVRVESEGSSFTSNQFRPQCE
jgi:hypothetical protein